MHRGAVASSILSPVCFSSLYRISAQNSRRKKKSCSSRTLETLPVGLSLEKQQPSQGGKVGNGGGSYSRGGSGLGLVLQSKSQMGLFLQSGSGRWVVCLKYQVGPSPVLAQESVRRPVAKGLTQQMMCEGRWARRRLWKPHLQPALKACCSPAAS